MSLLAAIRKLWRSIAPRTHSEKRSIPFALQPFRIGYLSESLALFCR